MYKNPSQEDYIGPSDKKEKCHANDCFRIKNRKSHLFLKLPFITMTYSTL